VEAPLDADMCDEANGEARIECQTSEQCPIGTVCCGDREAQPVSHYVTARCEPICEYPDVVFCDTLGEEDPDCPVVTMSGSMVQLVCENSNLLPAGYLVCGTP
jgi:hypothetical protein